MMIDLHGKVAVVTGASRGIGKAIAYGLQCAGASVAEVSRTDGIKCDISNAYNRGILMNKIMALYGRVDILVNNAGEQCLHSAADYPMDAWDKQIELLLTAPFHLSQLAARDMMRRGWGRIINITSIVGVASGGRNVIAYSAAKHGLVGVTKCLSNEWASYGIKVNAVAPGFTETDMLKPLTDDKQHSKEMLGRIPTGRYGTVEDIANLVVFLASDLSDYITGECITVDGGWTSR